MKIDLNTSLKNNIHENSLTKTMKISGKLCINFEVDTEKCKRDYIAYLYNIARGVLQDWSDYDESITLSIEEDGYVELDQ